MEVRQLALPETQLEAFLQSHSRVTSAMEKRIVDLSKAEGISLEEAYSELQLQDRQEDVEERRRY